ncbi:kinase-like domain-containing protein [Rhizophagus irregularis DAOM 181602=DAOM 197198]|nr:kinase-like domain-containing protein [Rhizophagus irregularis DAOM 181602=DAOM 197198]
MTLKSFYNLNDITLKEIVNELKLQREVDFHDNIIRFYGITKFESGIVHRDLHSCNVGKPPFHEEKNKIGLIYDISQGRREKIIPNTPNDYSNLYIECWNNEPSKRPNMHEVVNRIGVFIPDSNSTTIDQQNDISDQTYPTPNENPTPNSAGNSSHGELSQMIQNFTNMNTSEIDSMSTNEQINENISSENYFSIVINEIVDLIFKENIKDNMKDHTLAQYFVGKCYQFGNGITKNEKLAFEYYEKVSSKDYASGQFKLAEGGHSDGITMLAYCYDSGTGINIDKQKAVELYQKAANLGHKENKHSNFKH